MPNAMQIAKELENKYLKYAPKTNHNKIKHIIHIIKDRRNVPRNIAEKAAMALYMPSAFGRVGKRGKPSKADEIYEDVVSRYQDVNTYPQDFVKTWRYTDKLIDRKEMRTRIKRNY